MLAAPRPRYLGNVTHISSAEKVQLEVSVGARATYKHGHTENILVLEGREH